jgi:hypothetical protein
MTTLSFRTQCSLFITRHEIYGWSIRLSMKKSLIDQRQLAFDVRLTSEAGLYAFWGTASRSKNAKGADLAVLPGPFALSRDGVVGHFYFGDSYPITVSTVSEQELRHRSLKCLLRRRNRNHFQVTFLPLNGGARNLHLY